jgi:hypothetical protein
VGYDVSAHPVDVDLIHNRIFPYIRGEGDLSDLVETAVRLTQVRFRANAWGLGLLGLSHAESDAKRAKPKKAKASVKKKPAARPKQLVPDTFDSDLHVWGRPFFITTAPEHVSDAIDRYLAATPRQVDALAQDMLRLLNPELVGKVEPDTGGKLPGPRKLAEGVLRSLEFYRAAYPKLKTGEPVELPDGEQVEARELFLYSLPLEVVTFASRFQPGWMGRGYVWFTAFIDRAGLDAGKLVTSASPLFEPLLKEVKGFTKAFDATITQNYTVGGYVRPENVPMFREWMVGNAEKMIAACLAEGWDEPGARVDLQKVMEALRDAESRGMGFLEAAEIYSGPMGIMN